MRRHAWTLAFMLSALWPGLLPAQGLSLGGDGPVEIEATESLELHEKERQYIARGDARVRQGDVELRAQTLTADYRDAAAGGTEIWRVTAEGGVVIETPGERVQGDRGVYTVDDGLFRLTGDDLRLDTENETVTARDSLEFSQSANQAIARGEAKAVNGTDQIEADTLTADLTEDDTGKQAISVIRADGNVIITTPTDLVRGRNAVYDVGSRTATLEGDVRITRGQNQLNGEFAEVNLNTGVSRLLTGPDGGGRVRGLLVPSEEDRPGG